MFMSGIGIFWQSFVLMLLFGFASCLAQPVRNVIEVDLKNYGWQPPPSGAPGKEWAGSSGQTVAIDHEGRVLVAFIIRANNNLAVPGSHNLSLQVVRFTRDGKVDLSVSSPTSHWRSFGVYFDSSDHILARVNDAFQVLVEKHESLEPEAHWVEIYPCSMNCHISQSPTRRTLVISDFDGDPAKMTFAAIDTSTFPPRKKPPCAWVAHYAEQITDSFAYDFGSEGTQYFTRRWPLCDRDHGERLPLSDLVATALNDRSFVTKRLTRNSTKQETICVSSSEGPVRSCVEMPKHDVVESVRGDEQGNRFAMTIGTWRGGSRLLDISGDRVSRRIVIFNSESGTQIADIPVKPHSPTNFAISPDANRIAILGNGVLRICNTRETLGTQGRFEK
jgi:hypothetical protein